MRLLHLQAEEVWQWLLSLLCRVLWYFLMSKRYGSIHDDCADYFVTALLTALGKYDKIAQFLALGYLYQFPDLRIHWHPVPWKEKVKV